MAKSSYLFKLLFALAVCFYSYTGSADVTRITKQGQQIVVPAFRNKRDQVKAIYDSELGVREVGDNRGRRVEQYLSYVGLKGGEPWCAAFVCWVFGHAGIANPKSGWSPALFPESKLIWKRNTLSSTAPQAGDVFGIWFAEKNRVAHVGFVDQWKDNWMVSVEGNTNETGGRDGNGVYRKRRLVRSVYAVASYIPANY